MASGAPLSYTTEPSVPGWWPERASSKWRDVAVRARSLVAVGLSVTPLHAQTCQAAPDSSPSSPGTLPWLGTGASPCCASSPCTTASSCSSS